MFWDPLDPTANRTGVSEPAPPGIQSGYPSPAASIIAGLTTTIAYPTIRSAGSVPPDLNWVVLANVSPFALAVAQQRYLTTIPPYTVDKFQVAGQGGFTVSPTLPPNYLLPASPGELAGPTGAYATWYEADPGGSYPCAIGPGFPDTSQMILQATVAGPAAGPFVFTVQTEPWMQTLAVRIIQTGGSATGFRIDASDSMFPGQDIGMDSLVAGKSQWVYLPINGMVPQVTVSNLLNGAFGGTLAGQIMMHGLAGPIFGPTNGQLILPPGPAPSSQLGLTSGEVTIANATTAVVIPTNPSGTIIRVRGVWLWFSNAPAATVRLILLGTISGAAYWGTFSGITAGNVSPTPARTSFLVGQSGLADPTEGLSLQNNSSQTVRCLLEYDLLPLGYGNPNDYS